MRRRQQLDDIEAGTQGGFETRLAAFKSRNADALPKPASNKMPLWSRLRCRNYKPRDADNDNVKSSPGSASPLSPTSSTDNSEEDDYFDANFRDTNVRREFEGTLVFDDNAQAGRTKIISRTNSQALTF